MQDLDPSAVLDLDIVASIRALDGEGGTGLFEELVGLFVADAQRQVRAIEEALTAGDARTLERCAHTLKSSSASLGAGELSSICFELEKLGRAGSLAQAEALVRRTSEACRRACRALESIRS